MNFDLKKTLDLIRGGLLSHEATWNEYLAGNPNWQQTAVALTGPLIVLNVVLSVIFARMMGGYAAYGFHANIASALLFALVMAVVGFVVAVLVFNFLAGTFGGKANFSRAFAAVSLAAIPAWLAGIVGALIPGVGFLISLAGGIVSLVFLYKIMPLALAVPDNKRVLHFVVSLVAVIIINMVIGAMVGANAMRSQMHSEGLLGDRDGSPATFNSGVMGEWERQGKLMEAASQDTYQPPAGGKLSEEQVEAYAAVMRKARAAQQAYEDRMAAMAADMEAKEKAGQAPSAADVARLYSGVGTALSANNAEMEIVKTAGGNWAEHQWVKEQLRIAQLQQGEGSEAIEHNFALYQEYAGELGETM